MKNKKGFISIFLGLLLIAAALFLTVYNLYDDYRAMQSVHQIINHLDKLSLSEESEQNEAGDPVTDEGLESDIPDYILNPNMHMPVINIDGLDYIGVLEISSCNLKLPIISQWSYPNLKISPCRYGGSAYTNDLIIAAHNYNSHFGKLKNLTIGETIIFTDMDGNVFIYEVVEIETLMPTAIEEMKSGDWDLTLFTCTVDSSYRIAVRCDLVIGD